MKKIIITTLLPLLLFSPVAFTDNVVIGAPMSLFSDKWNTYLLDAIKSYDDEHDDVEIRMTDANADPAKMINDVDNFIEIGVDAILLHPTDPATVKPIAKKAKRAGIPLIVVNRIPNEEDLENITAYVGSESIEAGLIQAEQVATLLDGQPSKIAIILGMLGHEAQIKRTEGNEQVFAKHTNIEIVDQQEGRWDRFKGLQVAEDLLQKENLNAIVANNDEMAIGAILAANKAGIKDEDIVIAGVDATPDALEYLGAGLDLTVFQSAPGQGRTAAEMAHKAAKGEAVDKYYWIPFELVMPDQKEEYIKKYE